MARSEKLEKNLAKVQDMLDGNHNKKLQIGYGDKAEEVRKVGDTWFDSDGYEWEQKEGFKVKKSSLPAKGIADTCPDCKSYVTKAWDKDSYKHNGRCYYCQIDYEAQYSRHAVDVGKDVFEDFKNGKKDWNNFSDEQKQEFLDKNLDGQTKYKIERVEGYIKGLKEDEKLWKKEMDESNDKVFDKSVANALANSEIDTTNVKLKNN